MKRIINCAFTIFRANFRYLKYKIDERWSSGARAPGLFSSKISGELRNKKQLSILRAQFSVFNYFSRFGNGFFQIADALIELHLVNGV